jgi:hypothetical protein
MRPSFFRKFIRLIFLLVAMLVSFFMFGVRSFIPMATAQSSCDDPPFDVTQLAAVWDKTDFCLYQEGVFDEILSGGVPRDGIPPIDNPSFDSIDVASEWLQPQSPVIAVELDDVARAYPLAILTRHEIVNDVIGETPIAVTFCPLCNSAVVFDRRVDGQTLRFGVSGFLRNSDLIMWDDVTQSWWQQLIGEGIVGTYAGAQLDIYPAQVVSFGAFVAQYPAGEVLARSDSHSYGTNPYVGYDTNTTPFLFQGDVDDRLPATERVLAGWFKEDAVAYPFSILEKVIVINDTLGSEAVVAIWQPGATSALDQSSIDDSRDVGMAALYNRTFEGQILTFRVDETGAIRDDQTGSAWNIFGTVIEGEMLGSQLKQEFAFPHFWFAWAAFRPDTRVYGLVDQ